MHSLTPHLIVRNGRQAIEFYQKAFGAVSRGVMDGPDGGVMHAEMKIGDSVFMLADESPEMGNKSPQSLGGSPVTIHIYTTDSDKVFNAAVAAGATVNLPMTDMFWGDRYGQVKDPFGHVWSIATHTEEVPATDMERRMNEQMSQLPKPGQG
jgi:uncharacterized glyoxalase superfamily protein PhnB